MTLLDTFLPHHDVSEISSRKVAGAPSAVWAAVQTADLNRSWALRALLHLRALPHAVLRAAFRRHGVDDRLAMATARRLRLADLPGIRTDFMTLGATPGQELILGLVLPILPTRRPADIDATTFGAFDEPGYAKVAFSVSVHELKDGLVRLRTETRVSATSPRSRRVFRPYWMVVGPFSAYLRRVMLDAIAAEASAARRATVAD